MKTKEELKAYQAAYHLANRERNLKQQKVYAEKNKVKIAAKNAAWYARNRQHVKERCAKWYQRDAKGNAAKSANWRKENPEKRKAVQREYYRKNKTHIDAKARAWLKAHPVERRIYSRMSALKRRGVVCENPRLISKWERKWRKQLTVKCYWCLKTVDTLLAHSDHILALKNGGINSIENLCISCGDCNYRKNAKTIKEWNRELLQPVLFA